MISSSDLLQIIKDSLQDKQPLSVVRCGDGEGIVLNGYNDVPALTMVYKRQLGATPTIEGHEEIRNGLITAYNNADIIGVPGEREGHNKGKWLQVRRQLWEHTNVYGLIPDYDNTDKFASIDFHSHFLDNDYYSELLTGLDTLCYISCRDITEALKVKYNIKNVHAMIIAPETKFTSGYTGLPHYPDQYNYIKRWVTKVPVQGNLCLFGAGVVGKVYGAWLKEQGGIAVDIGSVFDSWAGMATRGEGRGLDKRDETFKL